MESKIFDGKKVRDEIINLLKKNRLTKEIGFGVIQVGTNLISTKYVQLKKETARQLGIRYTGINLPSNISQEELENQIERLNDDPKISAIMIQMPLPKGINRGCAVSKIKRSKDVDGLRYCAGLESDYFPPVVLAVEEAIKRSAIKLENSRVVILGRGFLVGAPLVRYFNQTKQKIKNLDVLGRSSENKDEVLANADLIISAVGAINVVKAQEIKKRAVLIDAGTTEINGALLGDIEHEAYSRSRFYTPVPGGIGPVTIAQLMKNVISSK